jgi:DNA (cytosine-5)-methyltransferase 1
MDADSCATLRRNRPGWSVLDRDITTIKTEEILEAGRLKRGEVALLAGGPPCQPFSKSGNWRNPHGAARGLKDPRAVTLREYLRVLKDVQPEAFLLENVFGLAYNVNQNALKLVLDGIEDAGYTGTAAVLNAADYGVPQIRQRLFIVGLRGDRRFVFPEPTHADEPEEGLFRTLARRRHVTAGEAIGDLDDGTVRAEEKVAGAWGHLLPEVPPGDNYLHFTAKRGHPKPLFGWRKRFWSFLLKLSPDRPSWTIQAQPGPYVGPFHWRSRRLRVDEIKRIQTFPDEYALVGTRGSVQRQLGNAVPCRLAQVLGDAIRETLGVKRPRKADRVAEPPPRYDAGRAITRRKARVATAAKKVG